MITLQNMIFANPQAYQVFPNMVNPYNTGTTELARYTGHLAITDNNGNTYDFTGTSTIDFTPISGLVTIDNITDRGSVRLGRWQIPQSIVITNDITITVTPIAEVSSDGATITPQYEVKYNTYHNGELTESTVITPDNVTLQSNVEWITINNNQIVVAANTNTEARQGQVTIQVSYQQYNTSANYNIIQAGYSIEDGIMDAMVLWYDLAKQGATNESMATTPTLIDHSGNGHDATCYNFAWSGMSGVGGYTIPPFTNKESNLFSSERFTGDSYNLIGKPWSNDTGLYWNCATTINSIEPYKLHLNVSGIVEGNNVYIHQYNNNNYGSVALVNGENRIQIDITQGNKPSYQYLSFHADSPYETDIHIEILPEYPNALVSDGVDDYCLVEGLPLLNKEDGYTVIAKRNTLDYSTELNDLKSIVSKRDQWYGALAGAFVLEYQNNGFFSINFGKTNVLSKASIPDTITYQTSTSYNGIPILTGDGEDTTILLIFNISNSKKEYTKGALYSLLLFNRDLTSEEIEWVKTNLIETEQ